MTPGGRNPQDFTAQLSAAIRAYPGETYSACAWQVLWDYACGIERNGGCILHEEHRWQTALQLFAYLCCFGMGRGKTRLASITIDHFADVLGHIRQDDFAALSAVKLERRKSEDKDPLHAVWRQLVAGLAECHVSHTHTMITKILTSFWGEAPAFDRFFKQTYSRAFGHCRVHTMHVLQELRDEYHRAWKPALDALEDEFTHTRRGQHNPIPVARLIDMAFWHPGYTNANI